MNIQSRQQMAEAELHRVFMRFPEETRASWTQKDYIHEMMIGCPALRGWLRTKSGVEHFWRRQHVIKKPPLAGSGPRSLDDAAAPEAPIHPPYTEQTLDGAADSLKREWKAVVGDLKAVVLPKNRLSICSAYQRNSVSALKVDKIAAELDLVAFGALTVAQRGDEFFIVDGQNRWMASQRRVELTELNCLVFQSRGVEHEAKIFAAININRSGVHAADKYRALVTAEDPTALALDEALRILQIEVVPRTAKGPNQLAAIQYVFGMAKRDIRRCESVLSVVQDITPGSPIYGDLVKAIDYLDHHIKGGAENPTLRARMRKVGAHKLMDAIAKVRPAHSGNSQIGIAVLGEVNRGQPESRRIVIEESE
jgi:hypothetical protein